MKFLQNNRMSLLSDKRNKFFWAGVYLSSRWSISQ